jgi:arylsulfatase A
MGQAQPARPAMIHHAANGRLAIRDGKWKLVMEHGRSARELYDLTTDPGEKNDVIAQHADIASRLTERITAIVQNGRTTPGAKQANDTGWWEDLAWIPDGGSSRPAAPAATKKRKGKTAQGEK